MISFDLISLYYQLSINCNFRRMKTIRQWQEIDQYHEKCVCQTCTCSKHRCPKCELNVPFQQISSYQNDYIKHPINTWQKPPPQKAQPYKPFGNISSSYQSHFPGHQPKLNEKLKPRVKDEDRNIPFEGVSEYKNKFPAKSVLREIIKIKDRTFNPDTQPFQGITTYKSSYIKKQPNNHQKTKPLEEKFPTSYKFDGSTTYGKSYQQKPLIRAKSCKPDQPLRSTGPHDLNTIYRKDYIQKKVPEPCPILKMPSRPHQIHSPAQHLVFNKHRRHWEER